MSRLHLCTGKLSCITCFKCYLFLLFTLLLMPGCSMFVSSVTGDLAENLSHAILNNDDLETVKEGGPAYLLLIDSLLEGSPDNQALLQAASTLYAAYATMFVEDNVRAQKLTDKAMRHALHAACVHKSEACSLKKSNFEEFEKVIAAMDKDKDIPILFTLGSAWAGWIQVRTEDWNAIAEISRVESIMQQVVKLDEEYRDGSAHLYLGAIASFPDKAREHFERAIEISGGKNLMAKVMYARQYARTKFYRELHDRLLREVLQTDPDIPGYTLINTLAQEEAQELLESADDYF